MSARSPRLEVLIDIFAFKKQRALVLPTLKPPELIEAVLQEFRGNTVETSEKERKLEYLSDVPNDYRLVKADTRKSLDPLVIVGEQIATNDILMLEEVEMPLPPGTIRPTQAIYLLEDARNKVYKLHWLPAIIGRPDQQQQDNNRLAVNLETHATGGLRVSRRHAQIVEISNRFYIEHLSTNPLMIKNAQGMNIRLEQDRRPILNGDTIIFELSEIELKFIVREEKPLA
jgi:hypothetical protein